MTADRVREVAREVAAPDGTGARLRRVRDACETGSLEQKLEDNLLEALSPWVLSLEHLADLGDAAAQVFAIDRVPSWGKQAAEASLAAMTAVVMGDLVLDAVAFAELDRRGALPRLRPGMVPAPWDCFSALVAPEEPMHPVVAYLDVTLVPARDALIAHRDPMSWWMPGFGTGGGVSLSATMLDRERHMRAIRLLRRALRETVFGLPPHLETDPGEHSWTMYMELVDRARYQATVMSIEQRRLVRRAQRIGGFDAPDQGEMAEHVARLVRGHVNASTKAARADSA